MGIGSPTNLEELRILRSTNGFLTFLKEHGLHSTTATQSTIHCLRTSKRRLERTPCGLSPHLLQDGECRSTSYLRHFPLVWPLATVTQSWRGSQLPCITIVMSERILRSSALLQKSPNVLHNAFYARMVSERSPHLRWIVTTSSFGPTVNSETSSPGCLRSSPPRVSTRPGSSSSSSPPTSAIGTLVKRTPGRPDVSSTGAPSVNRGPIEARRRLCRCRDASSFRG